LVFIAETFLYLPYYQVLMENRWVEEKEKLDGRYC
jgi:hypothetical protein